MDVEIFSFLSVLYFHQNTRTLICTTKWHSEQLHGLNTYAGQSDKKLSVTMLLLFLGSQRILMLMCGTQMFVLLRCERPFKSCSKRDQESACCACVSSCRVVLTRTAASEHPSSFVQFSASWFYQYQSSILCELFIVCLEEAVFQLERHRRNCYNAFQVYLYCSIWRHK